MRRLVAVESAGKLHSPSDAATIAKELHRKLGDHLSPIIGSAGFEALFARSVKKLQPAFSCLAPLETTGGESALGPLCAAVEDQTAPVANEIIVTLMVSFVTLLSTFIGEGLTWRLLSDVWPEVLPSEPPSGKTP